MKKSLIGWEAGQDNIIVDRDAAATKTEVIVPVVDSGMNFSAIVVATGCCQ